MSESILMYFKVFLVGGLICMLAQILINKTKITSARILVTFLLLGVILELFGVFEYIKKWAGAGVTIPICGFGSSLVLGAKEGAKKGLLEAVTYGISYVSGGLGAAIFFGFIMSLMFKSHSKIRNKIK